MEALFRRRQRGILLLAMAALLSPGASFCPTALRSRRPSPVPRRLAGESAEGGDASPAPSEDSKVEKMDFDDGTVLDAVFGDADGQDFSAFSIDDDLLLDDGESNVLGLDEAMEVAQEDAALSKYNGMKERGMTDEQIRAYLGSETVDRILAAKAAPAKSALDIDDNALLDVLSPGGEAFQQTTDAEDLERQALLGVVPSHTLVETDKDGEPTLARFVYVDEYTCIGCTHCASQAPQTFFMEDGFGRARVFQQGADTDDNVATAVSLCPVDCIHYVSWDELKRLEVEREGFTEINYKARLVGSAEFANKAGGMQEISSNKGYRCNNCPTKGCYECPMFSVGGGNPNYIAKRKEMARRRKERKMAALKDLNAIDEGPSEEL